jgi:nanoRNase/pAp phosphatase (c-di-AMP/oligoRNAs hydrolase)
VGVLFYFRSDGQYILVSDSSKTRSIGTSHSIIINKNTVMIVSLTKIYCTSDLRKKRTPTVYQNATQYNNQENNTPMTVYAVRRSDKRVDILFYIRSHRHYILLGDTVMGVLFS